MRSPNHEIQLPRSVEIYVPTESRYGELLWEDVRAEFPEQVEGSWRPDFLSYNLLKLSLLHRNA